MACFYFPALSSGAYERLCLLYNIASLYSEVANAQNLHSDDGLKTAAKMFQVREKKNLWESEMIMFAKRHNFFFIILACPLGNLHLIQ